MALTQYRMDSQLAKLFRKRAGAYVRRRREEQGYTQMDVAKRLGLDYYTMISAVELGHSRVPSEGIKPWADALNTPVEEFAKNLLEWYDPFMYQAIFGGEEPVAKVYKEDHKRAQALAR